MRCAILFLFTSLATLLAGQSWVTVPGTFGPQRYEDLTFVNDSLGFAVSSDGPVLRTTDGGLSWVITEIFPPEEYLRAVEFLDDSLGFTSSLSGRIFKTEDSGFNWTQVDLELSPGAGICGFEHKDDVVWGVGIFAYPAVLIKSTDRGENWTISSLDSLADGLVEVYFRNEQTGFIGGISEAEGAVILRTDDGGDNWRNVFTSAIPADYVWKIFPVGPDTLYASIESLFSPSTTIARSYDGGENWTEEVVEMTFNDIQGIGFLDGQTGWVSPRNSPGYLTQDGGDNWTRMAGIPSNINRFYSRPDGTLFAGGSAIHYYQSDTTVVSSTAQLPVHRNTILTAFPNPVHEQLNYRLEATRPTNHRIDLFSADGRHLSNLATGRIAPGSYTESYRLPANFPDGTFFLVLRSDDAMQAIKINRR
ncbi:hypothetical protein CEQ90_10585 [Lewinellaceae bacterium SD302]|nr:hypothetical protein CEQ90_10585 [Lewinellaceae bacterium SD302]